MTLTMTYTMTYKLRAFVRIAFDNCKTIVYSRVYLLGDTKMIHDIIAVVLFGAAIVTACFL